MLPDSFGPSWHTFVNEWCLGTPPGTSPEGCARALHALAEHLPGHVQALVSAPTRGLGVVVGAIDLGLVLADTANFVGFGPVMNRLRGSEHSAFSELTVAATFARLGFAPTFEVPVEGKVPDIAITIGSTSVYAEVITPNRSEIVKTVTDQINEIAGAILAAGPGGSIELFLDVDPDSVDAATVSRTIADSPYIDQPVEIPAAGRFIKRAFSFPPVVTPTIDRRTSGTVLGVARAVVEGNKGALVGVRVAVFDGRAKRLLAGELHHFPRNSPNVLVIDSGSVPGGVGDWVPSITRCFQPNQNTRISAVVLYQGGILGNPLDFHRTWKVLANPHAATPLPKDLLDALGTLPSKWPT